MTDADSVRGRSGDTVPLGPGLRSLSAKGRGDAVLGDDESLGSDIMELVELLSVLWKRRDEFGRCCEGG